MEDNNKRTRRTVPQRAVIRGIMTRRKKLKGGPQQQEHQQQGEHEGGKKGQLPQKTQKMTVTKWTVKGQQVCNKEARAKPLPLTDKLLDAD